MKLFLILLISNVILFSSEPEILTAQQKMQKAMVMAKARTIKKMQGDKIDEKTLQTVSPIKVDTTKPKKQVIFAQDSKKIDKEKNTGRSSKKMLQKSLKDRGQKVCKSSKKSLRESEIAEALSFYKKSSFYQFTK